MLAADRARRAAACALGAAFADLSGSIAIDSSALAQLPAGQRFSTICASIFVAEVFDRRLTTGNGCGFSETAQCGLGDTVSASSSKQVDDRLRRAVAVNDALEDLKHTLGAFTAGGAFAAGFVLGEVHEEPCNLDHAGLVVHDDQAAGADHCADLLEGVEIKRQVKIFFGQTAAGRTADLNRLEVDRHPRIPPPTVIDDFAQSGAHRDFDKTGVVAILPVMANAFVPGLFSVPIGAEPLCAR